MSLIFWSLEIDQILVYTITKIVYTTNNKVQSVIVHAISMIRGIFGIFLGGAVKKDRKNFKKKYF